MHLRSIIKKGPDYAFTLDDGTTGHAHQLRTGRLQVSLDSSRVHTYATHPGYLVDAIKRLVEARARQQAIDAAWCAIDAAAVERGWLS